MESYDRELNAVKITLLIISLLVSQTFFDSCSQRLHFFWSETRIVTSGKVQHWKSLIHSLPVTLSMFIAKSDKSDWLRV